MFYFISFFLFEERNKIVYKLILIKLLLYKIRRIFKIYVYMFLQVNEQEQKYDNFILIIIPFFIFRFVYVNFLLYSNLSREGCIHSFILFFHLLEAIEKQDTELSLTEFSCSNIYE
ncbi:hypothetical protein DERP_001120 [Dermatophagoides pteronyssinus]|uniref:Transmembrane protein n=1 Tax=Dermatophagoides pteronyssinus TaxID=6956 RepID=A0ABQ8JDL2_DERPT|nr:hypothetical protein DERP_001120 [Dermatophagoides pteronyssinus]